jgi:hypothetical protein
MASPSSVTRLACQAGTGTAVLTETRDVSCASATSTSRTSFRGVVNQMMRQHYTPRSREQVTRFFAGMDLVEPGLVPVVERPEPGTVDAGKSAVYGGVGRKH